MNPDGLEVVREAAGEDFYGGVESLCPAAWVNDLASDSPAPADHNRLGELRPTAVACLRYSSNDELARVVRNQLRQHRLFLRSRAPRPAGTEVRIQLQAPNLLDAVELHGFVEKVITTAEARATGGFPGMSLRIASLTDELLAELERSSQLAYG